MKFYEDLFEECSPKELGILEFFAKSLQTKPKLLKENLLKLPLTDRAKTLAFIQIRVPQMYAEIEKLLESEE